MALKIKSISGIKDIVISFADSANNVPATGIVGLETSGNIEQVVQGDKLFLVSKGNSQEYSGAGIIKVNGNTISADMDNYYTVDETNDLFDATSSYLSGEIDKKLDKTFSSNFYPMNENPSGYLTEHQDLSDYATTTELETVSSNITGMIPSTTGGYVPLSATACSIGSNNTATSLQSFSQGINNNCLGTEAFTQGYGNSAYNGALAQGRSCYASNYSIAQGSDCSALVSPAQAFGQGTVISSVGMAIGTYNKTSANVAFVIGNGYAGGRSDLFVIDKYGNVSAKSGFFYDKNGKVGGGGTTYKNGYLISTGNDFTLNFINYNCHNDSAKYNVAIGCWTTAVGSASVAMGQSTSAFGDYSHAEGNMVRSSGIYSHAEGEYTTANAAYAHTEGYYTSASHSAAHAEGYWTKANGLASHAEGFYSVTNGSYSHAEGYQTTADGLGSHADGSNTKAIGDYSLAVGLCTSAKGSYSHAGGKYTIANYEHQFVIGKYNDNKADTLFEIGNGTYDGRTNALEVYADGKVSAGDFVAGGVSLSSLAGAGGAVIIRYNLDDDVDYPATVNGETLSPDDCYTLVQNNPNVILRTYYTSDGDIVEDANFYPANFHDDGQFNTIAFTSHNVADGSYVDSLNVIVARNGSWETHSYTANYT